MKDFKNLDIKRTYTTLDTNIMEEVVDEILKTAVKYDRGVGFFSSSWLKEVASGLSYFILRGGKARILTSVRISEQDWKAIQSSVDKDEQMQDFINKQVLFAIDDLRMALETKTLAVLSFLIKEGFIEFKFAVPSGDLSGGIFHSKTSIYYNREGDYIVTAGSQNDSHQATKNEETINVFTSWGDGKLYADDHIKQYNKKWNGVPNKLKTYGISETIKRKIIEVGGQYVQDLNNVKNKAKKSLESKVAAKSLRPYQEKAVRNWFNEDCKGFFEMATGTGKTFTSISAINRLYKRDEKICFMVLVPYKHLAEQWIEELKENGYDPIPCFENKNIWQSDLNRKINLYKGKQIDSLCIVSLYATASGDTFQNIIRSQLNRTKWLLAADEAHNAGAPNHQKTLFPSANYRIGLSATPIRWFDDTGSSIISDFFGKTVIEYTLEEAIENKMLTPYDYNPVQVELTDSELEEYTFLSTRISQLSASKKKSPENEERLKFYLLKRSSLLAKAENKINKLLSLVQEHRNTAKARGEEYKHNIFYAASGEHKKVLKALSDIGLKVHEFVSSVPNNNRPAVLNSFAKGDIDGIVAIKCLDEGVDVPATKRAYVMSSTTNPKEFIQRRGRILRLSKNKAKASVYDFIIGPWSADKDYNNKVAVSLLNRELPRFAEFNNCSLNKSSARRLISDVCEKFNIIDDLDIRPYELYDQNKELKIENQLDKTKGEID